MRLIDADALNDEMYHKSFEVDNGRNVWNSGLWIRYKIFEEAIRDAPTVDAVPVRHGKWTRENNYGIWKCGECGCKVNRANPLKGNIWNYNYCPNCGAKMEAERKEE